MVIECRKNYVLFTCFTLYSLYASFHVAVQQNRVTILLQLAIRKFKSECNQTKHETRPKMIKKKLVIPTISWVNKHTRSSISHHSHFHEFNGKKYDFQINSVDYNAQIQWLFFFSHAISIFEYKLLFMCLAVDLCCMCHRILKIVAFFCMAFCHFIGKPTKTFNRLTESTTYANSVFFYIYYSYNVFKLYT